MDEGDLVSAELAIYENFNQDDLRLFDGVWLMSLAHDSRFDSVICSAS